MAKKTVFRALFKWLPITIEQAQAAAGEGSAGRYEYDPEAKQPEELLNIDYTVAQDEPDEGGSVSKKKGFTGAGNHRQADVQ